MDIPGVQHAVVIGDKRKFVSALLTLNRDRVAWLASRAGSAATDLDSAAKCEKVRAYVQAQVDGMNGTLSHYQTVKRFVILPTEFTIEGGELTHTMKIKRRVILQKFAKEIEGIYDVSSQ